MQQIKKLSKNLNAIQTTDTGDLVKETDYDTKIGEIDKRKSLIMIIVVTILLLRNLKS